METPERDDIASYAWSARSGPDVVPVGARALEERGGHPEVPGGEGFGRDSFEHVVEVLLRWAQPLLGA
jgi:hypothetical protein